jgi:hypothetical protein
MTNMESLVKVVVVLGTVGSVIAALIIASYFGNILGNSVNQIFPHSGDFALAVSNGLIAMVVIIVFVVILIVILKFWNS